MRPFSMLYQCMGLTYCLFSISTAQASGVFVDAQNGAGVGYAFAGQAALTDDASTAAFNPAGLVHLSPKNQGVHLSGSLARVNISTAFDNQQSTAADPLIPVGEDHSEMNPSLTIPSGQAVYVDQQWAIGLSITPMYGTDGEWGDQFVGRYQGQKTEITGMHVSQAYSFRLNPTLSLGVAVDYLNFDAKLSRSLPIIWSNGSYLGDTKEALAGDGDGWGGNIGLLWTPSAQTHIGLTYRSQIDLNLKGDLTTTTPTPNGDITTIVQTDVDTSTPQSVSLSGTYQLNPTWKLLGDVSWYDWSVISTMTAKNRSTKATAYEEALNFQDGWRLSAGAKYAFSSALELRGGMAYDASVVKDDQTRNVRFPDADRIWLSVGAGYRCSDVSSIDVGYAHVMTGSSHIDRPTTLSPATTQRVKGDFESSANLLSVQFNYHF